MFYSEFLIIYLFNGKKNIIYLLNILLYIIINWPIYSYEFEILDSNKISISVYSKFLNFFKIKITQEAV